MREKRRKRLAYFVICIMCTLGLAGVAWGTIHGIRSFLMPGALVYVEDGNIYEENDGAYVALIGIPQKAQNAYGDVTVNGGNLSLASEFAEQVSVDAGTVYTIIGVQENGKLNRADSHCLVYEGEMPKIEMFLRYAFVNRYLSLLFFVLGGVLLRVATWVSRNEKYII